MREKVEFDSFDSYVLVIMISRNGSRGHSLKVSIHPPTQLWEEAKQIEPTDGSYGVQERLSIRSF